jgi:uncharacterized membrane protein YcaP (DUF421 family)
MFTTAPSHGSIDDVVGSVASASRRHPRHPAPEEETMSEWFGASWSVVGFVALSTIAMYLSVLVGVRVAGRRTLTQLSAFDAVVTIALGSILATTALTPRPSYAQGATAVATLLVLQIALGWLRRTFPSVRRLVDFEALRLVDDGVEQRRRGLLGPQITEDELRSALRVRGVFSTNDVDEVVLEPSGEISVRRREPSS